MADGNGSGSIGATTTVVVRGDQVDQSQPTKSAAKQAESKPLASVTPGHSLGNPNNDLRSKDEILAELKKLNDKPSLGPAEQKERQNLLLVLKRKVAEEGAVDALMTADALIHGANTIVANKAERQSNIEAALDSYLSNRAILNDAENQQTFAPTPASPAGKPRERHYVFVETPEPLDTKPAPAKHHPAKHGPVGPATKGAGLFSTRK